MKLPNDLEKWDFNTILRLVDKGVFETEDFDFKGDIPQELDKTVCAFANSKGGFLIFGVRDKRQISNEDRIQGIIPKKDFPKEFGDKLTGKIAPPIRYDFKNPPIRIPHNENVIHVVHIPKSSLPHMSSDSIFWHRTNKGNERMTWHQIRYAFLQEQKTVVRKSAQFRYALENRLYSIMDNLLIRLCPDYDRSVNLHSSKKKLVKFFDDFVRKEDEELFSILVDVPFSNFEKFNAEYQRWTRDMEHIDRFPHADLLPEEQHAFINLKEEISLCVDNFDVYEYLEDDVRHEGKTLDRDMPYGQVLAISKQKELRQENLMVTIRFMKSLAQSIVRMQEKIEWMRKEYGDEALKEYL